ncbi:bifunctional lysylphosphatidylglycerol flippase/synthetase MprF [Romboutsia sp. 1001216sp1]|uniref:bifunctional lysylphosphatidylglycerol flippase/synthetase MprF n=1 Tax=unclassified Romboutsia TaxID=2626894 RepID=UPI00232B6F1D|nr:bifunctional lysylphosphatidylglycerol flippase/synthetase MprF [Romboutsia sp. 1001216sp1]MDB8790376.1 bifunctional lysylphosphatidylglycerol flippase/synthetase MprF [Romboutsia sp. 1001216sp1]MDB8793979.1 bifunctional lysylphosphatidylglycerol flippase/synthetase MprF [Romboutsia sp. 1001216sp1]MDB8796906.1 bifunctional lysylphosphatidylglycerol flippase/synthetase MprF [Romboutsia sp. 1001216sp1]MDB8800120.1 bifunctional lysylphosphatidylglycerol flippase/synthetase MprF [Romboutsia sp. 
MNKVKLKNTLKYLIALVIFVIVMKEFISVVSSFNMNTFKLYADKLTLINSITIILLGIISYLPLSLYDFVLKRRVNINLDNRELYKFSWIASSIASIAGFGGSTAIALKSNFYGNYVKDKKLLVKEISKIVALNLTGFSMVSFIYAITNFESLKLNDWTSILTLIISIYFPAISIYFIYKFIKGNDEDRKDIKDAVTIMGISALEWLTTIVLIYSIMLVLDANISFMKLFPVFVLAIIVAIVSLSPGGLGSFDLTMILGLQALNVPSEKVLLAIFLYRISYYIVPLIIGLILYGNVMWKTVDDDIRDIVMTILSKMAHIGIVLIVLLTGSILLISEAIPEVINKINIISRVSHLSIIYIPDKFAIVLGFLLIAMSRLLIYKSKNIYKLTLIIVALCIGVTFAQGTDYGRALYLVIVGLIIWLGKKQFYRESFVMRWGIFIQDVIILLSFLILYLYTFYASVHGKVGKIPFTQYQIQFSNASSNVMFLSIAGFIIAILFLCIIYYKNGKNEFPKMKLEECKDDVENILNKFGGTSIIHFIYLNDKYVYINKDKDVLIQYQTYANKIFILGNPVGNDENIFNTIQEFYELADKYGYIPTFCAIDDKLIPYLHETGYEFFKLGEEAAVDLNKFTLEGRKMKSVRNAISRVSKEEYTFEVVKPPFSDEFMDSIKAVSDEWLCGRQEKGFSIGFFDVEYLSRNPISIVKNKDGEIKGFANFMPMYDGHKTLSIDLMRFSHETCNGIMDFMFVNLFEWGKENGYSRFNMGMAPLSNVGISKYAFLGEKIAAKVYSHGHKFYSFQGLKKFKEKYCDSWDGRYMAYKRKTSLITTMIQVILLVSKPIEKVD